MSTRIIHRPAHQLYALQSRIPRCDHGEGRRGERHQDVKLDGPALADIRFMQGGLEGSVACESWRVRCPGDLAFISRHCLVLISLLLRQILALSSSAQRVRIPQSSWSCVLTFFLRAFVDLRFQESL